MTALASLKGPHIDWAGLSPLIALIAGALVVLVVGLMSSATVRKRVVPGLTCGVLALTLGLTIWQFHAHKSIIAGALRVDDLALILNVVFITAALAAVLLSLRGIAAAEAGHGEYHALLLSAVAGMLVLVEAQNMVALFLGLELLSIALYVLCATDLRRATSLESGLKYLVVGSVGSATLLYGLALIYGATGSTDFTGVATALRGDVVTDPLLLTGIGLVVTGLAFKSSTAPFHQWTPDVYEGAPTPITAFMAVATKAAAFGILLRFFDVALIDASVNWAPVLAALAAVTIVVGNVGALGQSSLKRLLAWSGVAQAGYLLAGVVVATKLGLDATVYYLIVYLVSNLAAFAVVSARERETPHGDDMQCLAGLGASRPLLAWPMTLAMLSLAGIPATAGFVGKFYLIDASVAGGYAWLGVMIVVGSMISLAYYLRVLATMWMSGASQAERPAPDVTARPAMAGGAPEADVAHDAPAVAVAVLFGAATLFFGIIPSPLFDLARHAGRSLGLL
ncbi:MAG: NADH-quinone oxidoreductase subunit N [Actinomycetota bacterium]|nr:NADH-quinone oxidoreductase subunit N [Actinomycetota bacterium]